MASDPWSYLNPTGGGATGAFDEGEGPGGDGPNVNPDPTAGFGDGQTLTPEQQAAAAQQQADYQNYVNQIVNSSGVTLGSGSQSGPSYDRSEMRYDQTAAERTAQQLGNYEYLGYEGGAADAAAMARGAVAPSAQMLDIYGNQFFGQAQTGAGMYGIGTAGLYGQAGALNSQGNLLNQYAQQGPGPSVAQAQLQANNAQAMRQQAALAGSGRGAGGGASAYRNAAANQAMMSGQNNAQASILAAQEAQNWRQAQLQAMGQAGEMYGQSGALYGQGAGLGAEYAQGMGDLASQAQQGSGQLTLGAENLAHDIATVQLGAQQAYEGNLTDIYGIQKGVSKQPDQPNPYVMAAIQGGAAALPMFVGSDIRAKKNIEPASTLDQLSKAGTYSYDYSDPDRFGAGRHVGPMAQELEGVPGVVKRDTDGTKVVDTGRLALANTSALSELNQKVDTLAGIDSSTAEFEPENGDEEFARAYATQDIDDGPLGGYDYINDPEAISPEVRNALDAFGDYQPSGEEIAFATEDMRAQYGDGVAQQFLESAMYRWPRTGAAPQEPQRYAMGGP
jgi:hypothetical protein